MPKVSAHISGGRMDQNQSFDQANLAAIREMLARAGYSEKAIEYYVTRPHMGNMAGADHSSEMTGTCGDTMKVYIKVDRGKIEAVKYQVLGCAGAIASAMAAVDLVQGKTLAQARAIEDGDVFKVLEEIPAKKHHCIQLAVKALHQAIDEYQKGREKTDCPG